MEHAKIQGWQIPSRAGLALALVVLLGWQWNVLLDRPPRYAPQTIELPLAPAETRLLGQAELAAPQADWAHLRVRRDADGAWWLSNVSEGRAVEVGRDGQSELLRGWVLGKGQRIAVAGQPLSIVAADDVLILRDAAGEEWRYDGDRLSFRREALRPCPASSWLERANWLEWNASVPAWLRRATPLELGGLLTCANRLPLSGVARASAWLRVENGRFVLRAGAGAGAARAVCVQAMADGSCPAGASLYAQEAPLRGVDRLIVGRTAFAVAISGERLRLTPLRRVRLFDTATPPVPDSVRWEMGAIDLWRWPFVATPWQALAAWGLLVALAAAFLQGRRIVESGPAALLLAAGAGIALLGVLAKCCGAALGAGWSLGLVSTALALMVLIPQRRPLAWLTLALTAVLLAIGLGSQCSLALAATDSAGWQHYQANAAVASAGLGGLFGFAVAVQVTIKRLNVMLAERALIVLAAAALLLLLAEVLVGNEAGVWGLQPVELAKLVLVLLSAHVLALRLDHDGAESWLGRIALWWRYLLPVLVFVVLMLMALLVVRDFSPLCLLAAWTVGVMLAWSLASGRILSFVLAGVLLAAASAAIWAVHEHGTEWLGSAGLYSDRVDVWIDPARHPHTGEQFQRGLALAGEGGLTGSEAAHPWRVPEVHNDFAPDYFLSRFGALGGMVLLGLQMLHIGCLLSLGWGLVRTGAGDFALNWANRLRYFALWGGAFMLAGHVAVSWGSNLGGLPVMGQPMPFISAAGSLLGLFLLPLQFFYISRPINDEEN